MKKWLLPVLVYLAIIVAIVVVFILPKITSSGGNNSACFKGRCFQVELAISDADQFRGLSGRASLASDRGMLFVFRQEGNYPFWMKDMKFPLDMIWISSNGTVVDFMNSVVPCSGQVCPGVYPEANASYVLEVNAGVINATGLNVGDEVELKLS